MSSQVSAGNDRFWIRPVLRVTNLRDSIAYYCQSLGFVTDWEDRGGEDPACAQVSRDGLAVILDERTYFPKAGVPSVVSLTLNDSPESPGLEALHRELASTGARIGKAPFKVHWDENVYEMDVEDLDGNVLMFWGNMPRR